GAGVPGLEQRDWVAERLRMRSERDLVQVPEPRLVVIRIGQLVQLVPVDEFLERLALSAAALHIGDEAVLESDLPARIEAAVSLRAGDDAVDAGNRLARQPLLLERRVVHEGIAESASCLIREHIQVAALVGA